MWLDAPQKTIEDGKEKEPLVKAFTVFAVILSVMGAITAIFQNQMTALDDKHLQAEIAIKSDIIEIKDWVRRLQARLRDHENDDSVKVAAIAAIKERLRNIERTLDGCRKP